MRIFQKILCPVDFSEYSTLALRYASALAKEYDAKLVVYHSVPDLVQVLSYVDGNYGQTVSDMLTSNAEEKLEAFISKIVPAKLETVNKIGTTGSPTEAILQQANEEGVDLIVMGTHGHSGYERFFVGSVTNRVLHKCVTPVLVVCKPRHHFIKENGDRPVEIKRILCAVDFEPNSVRIRDMALSLGRAYESHVFFLHVTNGKEKDLSERENEARRKFENLIHPDEETQCKIDFLHEMGDPAEAIVRSIEHLEIDLLVMGHHTRKPIEEYLLGSVTKRVVPDSACPVLVVRSEADLVFS